MYRISFLLVLGLLLTSCWNLNLTNLQVDNDSDEKKHVSDDAELIDTDHPCATELCNEPPAPECADDEPGVVIRYSTTGYCEIEDGKNVCRYAPYREKCISGDCEDGVCTDFPLQGIVCNEPGPLTCEEDQLVVEYPIGTAVMDGGTPSCVYPRFRISCENGCKNGQCDGDPCAGKFCNTPPASYCSERDQLIVRNTLGRCGEDGTCKYDSKSANVLWSANVNACKGLVEDGVEDFEGCEPLMQELKGVTDICRDRKVEDQGNLCSFVSCLTPPADFCIDENSLYQYEKTGECLEGGCRYAGNVVDCVCVDGRCEKDEDECVEKNKVFATAPHCRPSGDGLTFTHLKDICTDELEAVGYAEGSCEECKGSICKTENRVGELEDDIDMGVQQVCVGLSPQKAQCESELLWSFHGVSSSAGFCVYVAIPKECDDEESL